MYKIIEFELLLGLQNMTRHLSTVNKSGFIICNIKIHANTEHLFVSPVLFNYMINCIKYKEYHKSLV